ncbi:MAG: dihydrofolate reductase, partial [Aureibaculum sp.]
MKHIISIFLLTIFLWSCTEKVVEKKPAQEQEFEFLVEQFADLKILRYQIPDFENLTLKEKQLVYYLTQAGLSGRDIIWDQNYRHNLKIRKALENIYTSYDGDKTTDDWKAFEVYVKRVWFSNGIHHHYANDKIKPGFSIEFFDFLLAETNTELEENVKQVIFNEID